MSSELDVYLHDRQNDLPLDLGQVEQLVREVLCFEEIPADEVSISLVDEGEITRLHAHYFDDPTPTDCISFPIDSPLEPGFRLLGEVVVCPKTAIVYGDKHGVNPYHEVSLYLTHGLLHLIGYDDQDDKRRIDMRKAEQRHMEHLQALHLLLQPPDS